MKHIPCSAFVVLLLIHCVQAAEVPFVELKGHTDFVYSAAISPDGKKIVTSSRDSTTRIWDAESGKVLYKLEGHTPHGSIFAIFCPVGKEVVSSGWDRTVRFWDVESGKELKRLEGQTNYVMSAVFSPDGKKIIAGTSKPVVIDGLGHTRSHGIVQIWDTDSGKMLQTLEGHAQVISSVAVSPDGKKIAGCPGIIIGMAGYVLREAPRIWDVESGKEVQKLEGHTGAAHRVAFSPGGTKIVTAGQDKTVRIWDAELGRELNKLEGHTGDVFTATFSPDGKTVVTASEDRTIRIWDVASGKELNKLEGHTGVVFSVAFFPCGKKVLSTSWDCTARIWDISAIETK